MQAFDVSLPPGFVVPENNEQLTSVLKQLLPFSDSMGSALQYENKPKFGPSVISNLRVDVVRYDSATLNGRLRLTYDMQLTFGCEDFVKDHLNQHSYYNLRFNLTENLVHFESDAPEAPSTADEF